MIYNMILARVHGSYSSSSIMRAIGMSVILSIRANVAAILMMLMLMMLHRHGYFVIRMIMMMMIHHGVRALLIMIQMVRGDTVSE